MVSLTELWLSHEMINRREKQSKLSSKFLFSFYLTSNFTSLGLMQHINKPQSLIKLISTVMKGLKWEKFYNSFTIHAASSAKSCTKKVNECFNHMWSSSYIT